MALSSFFPSPLLQLPHPLLHLDVAPDALGGRLQPLQGLVGLHDLLEEEAGRLLALEAVVKVGGFHLRFEMRHVITLNCAKQ